MAISRSVAILGGGISGLATAHYLLANAAKSGISLSKVFLLESQPRFGGWLQTVAASQQADDYFELGPRTISTNSYAGTNAIALVGDIGLADSVEYVSSNSVNFNKRYVVIDGKLFRLPSKLSDLVRYRKPFKPFQYYLFKEFFTPQLRLERHEDISVDKFFRYRFGEEIADYLANPLCIGISGGDSKTLSMKSMFPSLYRKEQVHGSVVKGMFFASDIRKDLAEHWLVKRSASEKWAVFSFKGGIQALSEGLISHINQNYPNTAVLKCDTEVVGMKFDSNNQAQIKTRHRDTNEQLNFQVDHVFSSLPAFKLASILEDCHPKLKSALQSIPTVHMGVVSLQFDRNVLPEQFAGFGFLVPAKENSPILGVTFDSCIFPSSDPSTTKMTVMLGGYRFVDLFGPPDSADKNKLLKVSLDSLKSYLDIKCEPVKQLVTIHKDCIPQYTLDHKKRLATIEDKIDHLNLSVIGASYHGFSVPECILNAKIQANSWFQRATPYN